MHRTVRVRFSRMVLALVMSLGVALGSGAPSHATNALSNNAVFNNPNDATDKYAIQNYLIGLIDGKSLGGNIQVS